MEYEIVSCFPVCCCITMACPSRHIEESHLIINEDGESFCVFSADLAKKWYSEKNYSFASKIDTECKEDHGRWAEYGNLHGGNCGDCFTKHYWISGNPMWAQPVQDAKLIGCKTLRYKRN
jgi:hypothetical protein